ncbi:MAG: ABC transporter ATP-binding protein [Oscillospiraceae bacterium]|nr:ABC transporter ATP-binding protein [Oscillospiraceae bacterium]
MRYFKQVLRKNKRIMAAHIAAGVFSSFMAGYKAVYFQDIIDGLTAGTLALSAIIFYGLILFSCYLMGYLQEYPWRKLENGLYLDFKLMALEKISRIDYAAYQKTGTGKLVQRIENGAAAGRDVIFHFWLRLIRELIPTILFCVLFIWRISKTVTCLLLIGYVFIFITTNLLLKFLYRIKEKILNNEEQLNHYLVRGFMEMTVFRTRRQFPGEIRKAEQAKQDIISTKVKMRMIHEAFFAIFAMLVGLLEVVILICAWKGQDLSVGAVVALISLIGKAYNPVAIFNVIYVQYKLDKTAFTRLTDFLEEKDDIRLREGLSAGHLQGGIRIDGLSFRYDDRPIFENLSLEIRPGEKVAFVGESGCGKSTLAKLLTGLLKYDSGSITLDGAELSGLCLDDLYARVSYFSQEAPVFDGTIRENLVFDRDLPDEDLLEALRQVQLSELMKTTGPDTRIGERGSLLSGGEKQKLALARLWFEGPAIVILDEATSAMDNLTEEAVMKAVTARLQDSTVIAIAHRLSSVSGFDRIIVFRDGRITAQGTFAELLASDAYFAELYRASIS